MVGVVARTALDREGLVGIVNGIVGVAARDLGPGGTESVDRAGELAPQVILADLGTDAATSFASALRARGWGIPVLALLHTGSPDEVFALARVGVTGFLAPNAGTRGLLGALRHLLGKGCAIPAAIVIPVLEAVRVGATEWHTPGGVVFGLSAREAQAARCLTLGMPDREIGRALRIGTGTAKGLVHKVLRKLGVNRREAAVERLREMDRNVEMLMAHRSARALDSDEADRSPHGPTSPSPVTDGGLVMTWTDAYATGIDRIDEQHRMIFKMTGEYRVALDAGRGERTYGVLLDFLEHYIRTHFGFEERCMEEYRCPAAAANRAAHAEFTETLAGFRRRYAGFGYSPADARELVDTLIRWFSLHIARVDVRLRESVGI